MSYLLSYRQGSFAQSEAHLSLSGAMTRAYAAVEGEGCSAFKIERDGILVMDDAQIILECQRAKLSAQSGRMPQRAN
jgi:hypothetical protein